MPEQSSVIDFLTEPDGLFQFTISYPAPEDFPDLRDKSTEIFGYFFQTVSQVKAGEKTLLTIRKTKLRGASGDWSMLPEHSGQIFLPTKTGSGAVAVPAGGPLLAIAAVVAALAGLGLIYLIVDKVERITDSPAVSWVLVVGGFAVLVGIYSLWKKGKLV